MNPTTEAPLAKVIDFKLEKSKREMKKFIASLVDELRKAVISARIGDIDRLKFHYGCYTEKAKTIKETADRITGSLDDESKQVVSAYIENDIIALVQASEVIDKFLQRT